MRKITDKAVRAFYKGENFSLSNTQVKHEGNETKMYLHGNLIAILENNILCISNAGWKTPTTKERLNGLLPTRMKIKQIKGEWFFINGNEKAEFKEGTEFYNIIVF